ncbi:MAG: response regulator transcription factor [Kiritimatiellales bacterium]|jgi:DNA-binding NarL/FixJ family response regulator
MSVTDSIKKVLLVDDFHLCRTFFAEGLRQSSGLTVIEAANAADALKQTERICPDVIILNISMGHCSGMTLLQGIHRKFPKTGLLAFSYLHHDRFYAERAICAGAAGYISVDESGVNLMEAVAAIAAGGVYLSAPLRKKICVDSDPQNRGNQSPFERLSHREFEVFCLTGHGHAPKRIAAMLKVSVKTVETYRERIRGKLGLADGSELLYHATSFIREQSLPQPL